MASKTKSRPTTGGGEENSSTRKRIQDVLGQARAALRQSQQFRWTTSDTKNNNLSSRLTFQKQQQEDYWSTENAGEVIVEETTDNPLRPPSKQLGKSKSFFTQDDDFGLPFRESMKRFTEPKPLGATRHQQKIESGKKGGDDASSDSTSISMNTTELKGTSDDESDASESSGGTVSSLRRAPSKISKASKEVRIIEPPRLQPDDIQPSVSAMPTADVSKVPTTIKLTPLVSNPISGLPVPDSLPLEDDDLREDDDDTDAESVRRPPSLPQHTTTVSVLSDDLGFTRASVKKAGEDPHWFEKALLVRGEAISEAAYKAFKRAHEDQEILKKSSAGVNVRMDPSKLKILAPGLDADEEGRTLPNVKEPEFTADWISDVDMGSLISDAEIPASEFNDDNISAPELVSAIEETQSSIPVMDEDLSIIEEANTESIIRTATELEACGVLGEIAANLQNVLDISDKPESQDFSRMSAEERSFAREYDAALQDKDEPLGAIFHSVYSGEMDDPKKVSRVDKEDDDKMTASTSVVEGPSEKTASISSEKPAERKINRSATGETEEEAEYDENTFLTTTTTTTATTSKTKKSSFTIKSKNIVDSKTTDAQSKSSEMTSTKQSKTEKNSTALLSKSKSTKVAIANTSKNVTNLTSTAMPKPKAVISSTHSPKARSSPKESKTRAIKAETTTNRQISLSRKPAQSFVAQGVLEPPANRYQKNIQTILEKEVYQKELKRQRTERLREERKQERMERIAKESLERNRKTSWPEPKMTEILLPELFKYKSVSGLQAAKAKKSEHFRSQPEMNYGAPYFRLNGAIEADEGHGSTAQMLAKAQVETLDIPDLVREVLASNERMYRMTVETSRQMDRLYKDKLNARR